VNTFDGGVRIGGNSENDAEAQFATRGCLRSELPGGRGSCGLQEAAAM
jgi:hypothetical protein